MGDRFDDILTRGPALMRALNPTLGNEMVNNCPATADAVDDYLRTGVVAAADSRHARYVLRAAFRRRPLRDVIAGLLRRGHGSFIAMRGNRPSGSGLGPTHYANLVNIRGVIYVVDAYTNDITPRLVRLPSAGVEPANSDEDPYYFRRQRLPITALDFSTSFEAEPDPVSVLTPL